MEQTPLDSTIEMFLKSTGISSYRVERLKGGGNNQAYLVNSTDSKSRKYSHFLKIYHQDSEDPRPRGKTEYQWLEALWKSGVRNIPEPLGFHKTNELSAGLYGYISGRGIKPDDLDNNLVEMAAKFLIHVNSFRTQPELQILPPASEACFSIREHWTTVDKRISILKTLNPAHGLAHSAASHFILNDLVPEWERISKGFRGNIDDVLPQSDRILSPSDFGFHNALMGENDTIYFVDFEYAGWDDPAKLICDFFNQVSVPVSKVYFPAFLHCLLPLVTDATKLTERVNLLLPIYRIKWVCILLNHFLPTGARRKKFALQNANEWETLQRIQLEKAKLLLKSH